MGREVRMVPKDWQHPRNERGFMPMHPFHFMNIEEWEKGKSEWNEEKEGYAYELDEGDRPVPEDYMPDFEEGTATWYMMY